MSAALILVIGIVVITMLSGWIAVLAVAACLKVVQLIHDQSDFLGQLETAKERTRNAENELRHVFVQQSASMAFAELCMRSTSKGGITWLTSGVSTMMIAGTWVKDDMEESLKPKLDPKDVN